MTQDWQHLSRMMLDKNGLDHAESSWKCCLQMNLLFPDRKRFQTKIWSIQMFTRIYLKPKWVSDSWEMLKSCWPDKIADSRWNPDIFFLNISFFILKYFKILTQDVIQILAPDAGSRYYSNPDIIQIKFEHAGTRCNHDSRCHPDVIQMLKLLYPEIYFFFKSWSDVIQKVFWLSGARCHPDNKRIQMSSR